MNQKAQAVMEVIRKHEHLTQATFDKINTSKEEFQKTLQIFKIPIAESMVG